MVGFGIYLLMDQSKDFKKFLIQRRKRNPKFNRWLLNIKEKLPPKIVERLEQTEPRG